MVTLARDGVLPSGSIEIVVVAVTNVDSVFSFVRLRGVSFNNSISPERLYFMIILINPAVASGSIAVIKTDDDYMSWYTPLTELYEESLFENFKFPRPISVSAAA